MPVAALKLALHDTHSHKYTHTLAERQMLTHRQQTSSRPKFKRNLVGVGCRQWRRWRQRRCQFSLFINFALYGRRRISLSRVLNRILVLSYSRFARLLLDLPNPSHSQLRTFTAYVRAKGARDKWSESHPYVHILACVYICLYACIWSYVSCLRCVALISFVCWPIVWLN